MDGIPGLQFLKITYPLLALETLEMLVVADTVDFRQEHYS